MEIILAGTAGFCFGVKRAVSRVYEDLNTDNRIYTYGPIIHNDSVVNDLAARGVEIINDRSELGNVQGKLIIRSHGTTKEVIDYLEEQGIDYEDMTCPFVKRIHNIVYERSNTDRIIIIGNAKHPEVVGIKGWCGNDSFVIETHEEAEAFEADRNCAYTIVSQTTFNHNKFKELVEIFTKKGYHVNVVNTICDATKKRQEEAAVIASKVGCMIVVGDKKSSNSRKLYDICSEVCACCQFIENAEELDLSAIPSTVESIGITAGASTPNNIIEEVQNYVRINF